ncbi:MAG: DUF1189 family protein [bacterium]|nr:DUF1189 family protein [bacterium]
MKIIENIKSSIYNSAYYSEILNKPFSYSLKYFLSLICLIALVSTIIFTFSTLPKINKVFDEIGSNVLNYYPEELEITVKNGIISTNVSEPYFIKAPAEFKNDSKRSDNKTIKDEIDNLLVIDTQSPLNLDAFKDYKTFVLISRDSIAYRDSNEAIKIQFLNQEFNGVITKTKISSALNKIMPYLKVIPLVLVPLVFVGSILGATIKYLIYLIFGALVIWIMAKAMKRNLRFGKSYQIGIHAITLGVILEATVFRFYPNLEFPLFFTLLMFAIVWINLKFLPSVSIPIPTLKKD